MKTKRFIIERTITTGNGINAEIELDAIDETEAEQKAAALFSHEKATATYRVQKKGGR